MDGEESFGRKEDVHGDGKNLFELSAMIADQGV